MNKKIPLEKETYEKLEKQAKAEGKTLDQKAAEIIVEKTAEAKSEKSVKKERKGKSAEKKSETAAFPAKGMVNAYGFLHLSNGIAEAFGAPRGKKTAVTIDFKDGSLIISKTS